MLVDPVKQAIGKELKRLGKEDPEKLKQILSAMSPQEREDLFYDWAYWGRPKQFIRDYDEGWPEVIIVYCLGRGGGKAVCNQTRILTQNRGWITMGEIEVGDVVFDEQGNPTNVLATYSPSVEKMFEFTFADGTSVVSHDEHEWVTYSHREREELLRQGVEICNGDWPTQRVFLPQSGEYIGPTKRTTQEIVDTFHQDTDLNHCIPVCKPLQYPSQDVLLSPYLLGLWLGDTSATAVLPGLKELGVLDNKHIPENYLYNSYEVRLALLQGLMDSGGCAAPGGAEFCSTRKELAESVLFLARSLGFSPTLAESTSTQYRVTWSRNSDVPVFRLPRKLATWCSKEQLSREQYRMIVDVKEVPVVPCTCITVDSPNSMYLITEALIPTHNTRLASEWIKSKVKQGPQNILLIGPTSAKIRDIMVLGDSGILSVYPEKDRPEYQPSYSRVTWKNGSVGSLLSGEEPDRIRGANASLCWFDELGEVFDEDVFDQAMLALRKGESRMVVTTTPRLGNPTLLKLWERAVFNDDPPQAGKDVRIITGSTYENLDNLSKTFKSQVIASYEGTRLGKQEIEGIMLFEQEGALWTTTLIQQQTVGQDFSFPRFDKICIGVDPAVTSTKKSDKTGIVVAGLGEDGNAYVLKDLTDVYGPSQWTTKVGQEAEFWSKHATVEVVVESNQGGELVKEALLRDHPHLYVTSVFSSKSKIARAEPVAAMYERGKVWHARGEFEELEREMCIYAGLPKQKSPDRMDALVFAITRLLLTGRNYVQVTELNL